MTRRVLSAIVIVAALVIVGFGVPLGAAVQDLYREEALAELVREAARAGTSVPSTDPSDPIELRHPAHGVDLAVYGPDGRRLTGTGPAHGGDEVTVAATGRIAEHEGDPFVVATPISSAEQVVAVVRAELPASTVANRVHRAWLLMSALAAGLLVVAVIVGRALSTRISKPVAELASASARLGHGDFTVRPASSGIAELDAAADNLALTAERLGRLVERERAFSADVSHQLRTPLTGLRLHLETALANPTADPRPAMDIALGEVDRLEGTIDDLLALAREEPTDRGPVDLREILDVVEHAWHGPLAAQGRPLRVDIAPGPLSVHAARAAVVQVLDVLVGNAAQHGRGVVQIRCSRVGDGVVLDVSDDGPGPGLDADAIFQRRAGSGHGIGLSLARSLVHAEGGRLLLAHAGSPTTFRLVLRDADHVAPTD
ncbi:MAG: HAMP domain-containing histidine kinase [Actinobacteria bacterium]|nr:HAMP domain-containing histidine kinase [Actinomycetota bacterium]MBV9664186.1 HAMP domain-containing histidine kinase [Actinomycetota bacterium]MBV9935369.1 HAMP domain-containing histidine kinase [Actinomycetota bacterium]